ncbi:MAG: lytic transglycosylase domain-containing protein [Blastocatellia bacterium]
MGTKTTTVAALTVALCWQAALAESVPWGYQKVAKAHGIPPEILYAVATTESNQKLRGGLFRPWPWTLNVQGRPERYPTRNAAHAALTRHLSQGSTRIDVGLMQVNWQYHKNQLGSTWEALEPYHNLRVGSRILRAE